MKVSKAVTLPAFDVQKNTKRHKCLFVQSADTKEKMKQTVAVSSLIPCFC